MKDCDIVLKERFMIKVLFFPFAVVILMVAASFKKLTGQTTQRNLERI